jgi:hypothetical protein
MSSKDALTVHVSIILLRITIITRETLFGVGDVKTSIGGTLECAEDAASSRGGFASNIEEGTEGAFVLVNFIYKVSGFSHLSLDNISVNFGVALINIIQTNLLEQTTGTKQSGAVRGGIVLKTDLKSITGQFVRTGGSQNAIAIDETVHNLTDDLLVGETHNETVFGRLVLVLGLAAETLTLTVVGASFATTAKFDLEALVVRFGFGYFDKHHG